MKEKSLSGIYTILNRSNEKRYIGASVNVPKRIQQHQKDLMLGKHENYKLQDDYMENPSNFEFSMLELVSSTDELNERENFYIRKYKACDESSGYNISPKSSKPFIHKHLLIGYENLINDMKKKDVLDRGFSSSNPIGFGEILLYMRKRSGLSQLELSKKIGISRTNISKYESNKLDVKAATLINWCNITDCQEVLVSFIFGVKKPT